jgi:hypothetical protein
MPVRSKNRVSSDLRVRAPATMSHSNPPRDLGSSRPGKGLAKSRAATIFHARSRKCPSERTLCWCDINELPRNFPENTSVNRATLPSAATGPPMSVREIPDPGRAIRRNARQRRVVAVCIDERGFSPIPCSAKIRAPASQTPVLIHTGRWPKFSAVSGVTPAGRLNFPVYESFVGGPCVVAVLDHSL